MPGSWLLLATCCRGYGESHTLCALSSAPGTPDCQHAGDGGGAMTLMTHVKLMWNWSPQGRQDNFSIFLSIPSKEFGPRTLCFWLSIGLFYLGSRGEGGVTQGAPRSLPTLWNWIQKPMLLFEWTSECVRREWRKEGKERGVWVREVGRVGGWRVCNFWRDSPHLSKDSEKNLPASKH